MEEIEIYTDGSCLKNPGGPGGWAYLIVGADGRRIHGSGFEPETTNNRMELTALLRAMRKLNCAYRITLYSDSKYLLDGCKAAKGWSRRGWKLSSGASAKNIDLWKMFLAMQGHHEFKYQWVRGHNGHPENEYVDTLAREAAKRGGD